MGLRRIVRARVIAAVALAIAAPADATHRGPGSSRGLEAAWVQLGPSGAVLVRALTEDNECPHAVFDRKAVRMTERAAPRPPEYPVRSCEAAVPPEASAALVGGHRLRTPVPHPHRIVVLGDTGCRLKAADGFQACNDPEQWPFAEVAKSVARLRPDLIIQVGDYLYREEPCPPGNSGCAGSPFGYNWPTWKADFFDPAAPALAAAPWLFVRGDHELCSRAGEGWFRFLDPRPMAAACADVTEPYAVDVGGVRLVVMDTVAASDRPPLNPEVYASQFASLGDLTGPNAWLLMHRPLWGVLPTDPAGSQVAVINETLQVASGNSLPPGVRLVLTGHIHLAEVLSFDGNQPPHIVAGIGGTLLLPDVTAPVVGMQAGNDWIAAATILARHGFITFDARRGAWTTAIRDVQGIPIARCRLTERSAECRALDGASASPPSER